MPRRWGGSYRRVQNRQPNGGRGSRMCCSARRDRASPRLGGVQDARMASAPVRAHRSRRCVLGDRSHLLDGTPRAHLQRGNPARRALQRRGRPRVMRFLLPLRRRNRSEEHTSELQSHSDLVCRLLLEKKKKKKKTKMSNKLNKNTKNKTR